MADTLENETSTPAPFTVTVSHPPLMSLGDDVIRQRCHYFTVHFEPMIIRHSRPRNKLFRVTSTVMTVSEGKAPYTFE